MRKIRTLTTSIFFIMSMYNSLYALEVETHKAINVAISEGTYNGFSLDSYLKTNLGLTSGIKEILSENNNVTRWLELGGEYEDKPHWYYIYLRSLNHFHNPLTEAGFSGIWGSSFLSGMSVTQWALLPQNTQSSYCYLGCYSWDDVRSYFYTALISTNSNTRSTYFAETFRGLGQLMHLVQDMSVPEHARDDGHLV